MSQFLARILVALSVLCATTAQATQTSLVTPGPPLTMANLATFLNNAFLTLGGCSSGASAPAPVASAPIVYQCWIDTTANPRIVKIYDGANWVSVANLDVSAHTYQPIIATIKNGSGTITLPTTTDTLMGRATTDTMTGKTYDTAGSGNSFLINGLAATANTGTGAVVRAAAPIVTGGTFQSLAAVSLANSGFNFDFVVGDTLSANRSVTFKGNNVNRTIDLSGNVTTGGAFVTGGALTLPAILQGDLMYGSSSGGMSALNKNTTASRYLANTGTTNNPAWDQVDLTNGVKNALPVANGGTNASSASGTAVDNISGFASTGIMSRTGAGTYTFSTLTALMDSGLCSTQGDIIFRGASTWSCLATAVAGNVLTTQGAGNNPTWTSVGGTGTVTSVICGSVTITTTGTCSSPYFSANLSASSGSITNGTPTKIQFNTETNDSNGWYDNATNFRFTPLLAGRYRVVVNVECDGTTISGCYAYIYKNGSQFAYIPTQAPGATFGTSSVSAIIQMNGSTDFVEGWGRINGTGTLTFNGQTAPVVTTFAANFISP
jgi:hypothetical protein